MKIYARIANGVVVETFATDRPITELFHPGLVWVVVPPNSGVAERWVFDGSTFSKPAVAAAEVPAPTMAQILSELAALKAAVKALGASSPPSVRNS